MAASCFRRGGLLFRYLLAGLTGLLLLGGCTSKEEYQQGVIGFWQGEMAAERWCMSLNASGEAEILNEKLDDAGQLSEKKISAGTWEVRDGGRLTIKILKQQITTYSQAEDGSGVSAETTDSDRRGLVRYFVASMSEDTLVYRQQKMGGVFSPDFNTTRAESCN